MTSIRLEGVERCLSTLAELPRRVQKRIVPKAVRAGGSPFLKAARAKAPTRNRLLKQSLTQVIRIYDGTVLAVIGQEKGKRFRNAAKRRKHSGGISGRGELTPVHLVEEGVQPHEITGSRETVTVSHKQVGRRRYQRKVGVGRVLKPLAIRTAGGTAFRLRVRHPGHKGRHFIRAAAAEAERAGLSGFENKLVEELLKES